MCLILKSMVMKESGIPSIAEAMWGGSGLKGLRLQVLWPDSEGAATVELSASEFHAACLHFFIVSASELL